MRYIMSEHAKSRLKRRKGVRKDKSGKDFSKARKYGLLWTDIPNEYDELKSYMIGKYVHHMYEGPKVILYEGFIYIVVGRVLVTVYDLPDELYKMALELEAELEEEKQKEWELENPTIELPVFTLEDFKR